MRKYLKYISFIIDDDISKLNDSELLNYFDNPSHFYIKDSRNTGKLDIEVNNYLVALTHGEYRLPKRYEENLIEKNKSYIRLLKNFSDFGTKYIIDGMKLTEDQIVRNNYSRGIGDCNRDINDVSEGGYIRKTDFSGNTLFLDTGVFLDIGKRHYRKYHDELSERLEKIEEQGKTSFLFDLHDTGVRLMKKDISGDIIRHDLFPGISIANLNGNSCDSTVLEYFSERIELYLGIPVALNTPYEGGYVIRHYGCIGIESRNVIQVELARFLYMKESTQEIDIERARIIGDGLNRAMRDTVIKFTN